MVFSLTSHNVLLIALKNANSVRSQTVKQCHLQVTGGMCLLSIKCYKSKGAFRPIIARKIDMEKCQGAIEKYTIYHEYDYIKLLILHAT